MKEGRGVQYFAAFALSLATATIGITSTWPTPVIPKFNNNETNVDITEGEISWMLALSPPGFLTGSLATRFISDRFGRKTTIVGSAIPYACGMIIAALARKAWLLFIMKLLWGFGTGMIATVASIYLAEIADKDIRGSLSVGTRFMTNFGTLLMMVCGPFLSYEVLNYSILVFPICFFIACFFIPESPYYYLKEGKVYQARKVLKRLRGNKEEADAELELLKADVQKDMSNSSSVLELFTGQQYRKAIIISAGLKITQIMTGALTIQQYLGRIMEDSKSNMSVSTALIIFGAVKFVVGIMSSMLVDKIGRRPLLIWSYLGSGISLAIVGIYFFLQEYTHINQTSLTHFAIIPLVGIIASNVISTIGFISIIGIIPAELFPLNVKAIAMTSLNIFGGCLGFIVAKGYQEVKDSAGLTGVFWIFAVITISGAVFAYFCVPETRNKSLREIQVMLHGEDTEEAAKLNDIDVDGKVNNKSYEMHPLRDEIKL